MSAKIKGLAPTAVRSLMEETNVLKEAKPGGLIAVGTDIDPSTTKTDSLVGSVVGHPKELPEATNNITININMYIVFLYFLVNLILKNIIIPINAASHTLLE